MTLWFPSRSGMRMGVRKVCTRFSSRVHGTHATLAQHTTTRTITSQSQVGGCSGVLHKTHPSAHTGHDMIVHLALKGR